MKPLMIMSPEQKEMETNRLMEAADTDRDGVIDWDEFQEWFIPTAKTIQADKRRVEQIRKQQRAQKAGKAGIKTPRDGSNTDVVVEQHVS